MKIKTKLTLSVGLLFILIIFLSLVGVRYMYALKSDTDNILVANYNSLKYSRNMLSALEQGSSKAIDFFENNLVEQETNITEIGEQEATSNLRTDFNFYKANLSDTLILAQIREGIFRIMDLNMEAIQRKSQVAKLTADNAVFWIALTGTLCFLIAFILLINLPSSIANPISELTESIRQIAAENYSERVNFESHSEFGELAKSFNTMAKKLEEYSNSNMAKLMMEKKRIETLINNMHDPVIGVDEKLKVLFANEEAIKIIGIKSEDLIGHFAQDLALTNDLIKTLIFDLVNVKSKSEHSEKTIKIYSNNKESYFEKEVLHISITPTGEETTELIGHVILLRNVTTYKELDFAKTNFIATVSHEFKTPISSIKMSVQLLENQKIGDLNEEQKNLLDSIMEDANRLLKITSELLNMTQVETGNIQLSILPTDPKEILSYAINATKTQADQKLVKMVVSCPENIPLVYADMEKSAWVLTNLLSNAIRYSYEHSSVFLNVAMIQDKVEISVRDTGLGIAPQYRDKIFDRYFRIPGSNKEGTGLGLAISKEFVEAQGGSISVDSEFGSGSTFKVIFNKLT